MQNVYNYLDKSFIEYKETEHIELLKKWLPKKFNRTLKTDLFEEAYLGNSIFNWLRESSSCVTAIDISFNIVKKAKALIYGIGKSFAGYNKHVSLIVADIRKLALKGNVYDLVVSTSTLDHFPEINIAIEEIHRILKSDGLLFLTLHNKHNPLAAPIGLSILPRLKQHKEYFQWNLYTIAQAKAILKAAGFTIIDYTSIVHVFPLMPSLIKILRKFNNRYSLYIIEKIILLLKVYGRKKGKSKSRLFTAWFIAFLAQKQ